jgi:hypothetical protein
MRKRRKSQNQIRRKERRGRNKLPRFRGSLRRMADDALRCYLESTLKEGGKIPQDREAAVEKITVSI